MKDWGTNAYLAAGKTKDTNRYKSADAGLKNAKLKDGVSDAAIYGIVSVARLLGISVVKEIP